MTDVVTIGSVLSNRYAVKTLLKSTPAMFFGDAVEEATGRPVTVHVFHSNVSGAERWRQAFMDDAARLMTLPDMDQPAVLDRFVSGDMAVLVCEQVDGGPLIADGERQDAATVIAWAADIASLLKNLHGLSTPIYGRSSRPETLWRRVNGTATLLRFGVPEPPSATSTTSSISPYQAPETFGNSARQANDKADTYWLGAIMLLALNGKRPATGPDRAARNARLDRPKGVPEGLWELVEKSVAIKPQDRPLVADVLKKLVQLQA